MSWRYGFARFLPQFVIVNHKRFRVLANNFQFCEYDISLNNNGSWLTVPILRNEVRMGCTCALCRRLVVGNQTHLVCSLNPILTMRFAISLKRSADPNGGREWQLTHSSSVNFASGPLLDTWVSGIHENIEMDPIDPPNDRP